MRSIKKWNKAVKVPWFGRTKNHKKYLICCTHQVLQLSLFLQQAVYFRMSKHTQVTFSLCHLLLTGIVRLILSDSLTTFIPSLTCPFFTLLLLTSFHTSPLLSLGLTNFSIPVNPHLNCLHCVFLQ